jgi:hypothetical protein
MGSQYLFRHRHSHETTPHKLEIFLTTVNLLLATNFNAPLDEATKGFKFCALKFHAATMPSNS